MDKQKHLHCGRAAGVVLLLVTVVKINDGQEAAIT
jgi:hypothetical protein